METSTYQGIKLFILKYLPLSKDAVHVHLGLTALLVWIAISRKPICSWIALIPVLILAVLMEVLDLRDDMASLGYFRWGASLHDVVNTIFWPFILVLVFKLRLIRSKSGKE